VKQQRWTAWLFGLGAIALLTPTNAQATEPNASLPAFPPPSKTLNLAQTDTTPSPSVSSTAADLIVPARAGAGYNTSSGGYEGFGSFQGFIPLYQTPGKIWSI